MLEQAVRELRDREHEHQVEEQLDERDAMMLVPVPHPQLTGARREHASGRRDTRNVAST